MSKTIGLVFDERSETPKPPVTDKTFDKMKKPELEAYAVKHGINIASSKTNADIIAQLEAAKAADAQPQAELNGAEQTLKDSVLTSAT